MARLSPNAPLRAAVAYPLQNCVEFPILERVRNLALTNGDVHDNWPPKEFSGFLDMVAQGGLPATLQRMLSPKFRTKIGLWTKCVLRIKGPKYRLFGNCRGIGCKNLYSV
jgi:hypothetical protein